MLNFWTLADAYRKRLYGVFLLSGYLWAKSGLKIDLALIVCVLRRFAVLVGGVISTREGG